MEAKIRTLETEMAEIVGRMPKEPHHARLSEMERLLAREPEWHEWRSTVGSIRDHKAQLQEKRLRLLDRLGIDESATVLGADVRFIRKNFYMNN